MRIDERAKIDRLFPGLVFIQLGIDAADAAG
jgi:hypothetical protein